LAFSENTLIDSSVSVYSLPAGAQAAVGSYALVAGTLGVSTAGDAKFANDGLFYYVVTHKFSKVTDGTSHTMMVGEVIDGHTQNSSNIWTRAVRSMDSQRSTDNPLNTWPGQPIASTQYGLAVNGAFASRHPGGCQFVFGDAHIEFLQENLDAKIYNALATRAGNEALSAP
jgi:prepilin-type processing-associated H-X9-DG protein